MDEERLILPPPVHRRRESEILNELPSVLGLVLWQDVRHLHAWVEATEASRSPRRNSFLSSPQDFREAGFGSFPVEDAAYILRRLVGTLPTPDYGVAGVLDAVDTAYQREGMHAPEWVRLVRHELGKV